MFTFEQLFRRYHEHLDNQYAPVQGFFEAEESYYHLHQRWETTKRERLNHGLIDQEPQYGILDRNGMLVLGPSEPVELPAQPLSAFAQAAGEER